MFLWFSASMKVLASKTRENKWAINKHIKHKSLKNKVEWWQFLLKKLHFKQYERAWEHVHPVQDRLYPIYWVKIVYALGTFFTTYATYM